MRKVWILLLLPVATQISQAQEVGRFFQRWEKDSRSITDGELGRMDDTVRAIYEVFKEFYDPFHLRRIGDESDYYGIYAGKKYVVLEDTVRYALVDVLDKDSLLEREFLRIANRRMISVDSVRTAYLKKERWTMKLVRFQWPETDHFRMLGHFRPQVRFTQLPTLVINRKYEDTLRRLVERGKWDSIMTYIWSFQHRRGGSDFYGRPMVGHILLDRQLEHAVVNFAMFGDGWETYLRKTKGKWEIVESEQAWSY